MEIYIPKSLNVLISFSTDLFVEITYCYIKFYVIGIGELRIQYNLAYFSREDLNYACWST